jgi:hypothetical protein
MGRGLAEASAAVLAAYLVLAYLVSIQRNISWVLDLGYQAGKPATISTKTVITISKRT